MGKLKTLGLMCFSIFIFSCANVNNISSPNNNVKPESVIDKAKRSVVLLSSSISEETITDEKQSAACSGVVIDKEGHILTNFHCVYQYNYIRAFYWSETSSKEYRVTVIGTDPLADLALLKVEDRRTDVPHLTIAENTEKIKEGLEVIAIGHPASMVWTVTKGIISSNDRILRHPYIKGLQTDASINLGNSGGPLLNMKGEIIGINSLIISRIKESAGLGLSVRGDIVKDSYERMLEHGKVDRPAIGIMIMNLRNLATRKKLVEDHPKLKLENIPNTFGLIIRDYGEEFPVNLKAWDTIIAVNDVLLDNHIDFSNQLNKHKPGDTIELTIIRNKRYMRAKVTLKVLTINPEDTYKKP